LNRWGLRTVLFTGVAGFGLSMAIIATCMSTDGTYWALLPGMVVWALFAGLAFPPIFLAASTGTPADEQGVAAALTSTSQYIGGAVGLAVLVGIANTVADGSTQLDGLRTAGWAGTAVVLAGAAAALSLPKRPDHR
jgi:MFS family permease